jgi:hypothetical protein
MIDGMYRADLIVAWDSWQLLQDRTYEHNMIFMIFSIFNCGQIWLAMIGFSTCSGKIQIATASFLVSMTSSALHRISEDEFVAD